MEGRFGYVKAAANERVKRWGTKSIGGSARSSALVKIGSAARSARHSIFSSSKPVADRRSAQNVTDTKGLNVNTGSFDVPLQSMVNDIAIAFRPDPNRVHDYRAPLRSGVEFFGRPWKPDDAVKLK